MATTTRKAHTRMVKTGKQYGATKKAVHVKATTVKKPTKKK